MNENLVLALKKLNEALGHLEDYQYEEDFEGLEENLNFSVDDVMCDLEEVISPLSDEYQKHF